MIKIIYFDERELLVRRGIETKALKGTEVKVTKVLPVLSHILCQRPTCIVRLFGSITLIHVSHIASGLESTTNRHFDRRLSIRTQNLILVLVLVSFSVSTNENTCSY